MAQARNNLRPSKGIAFWQQHISSWQHSDLTKTAYCRANDLAKSTFDCWHKKLQPSDTKKAKSRDFLSLGLAQETRAQQHLFQPSPATAAIEIQFQQGILIRINSPVDHDTLFHVLQVVRQLP